MKSIADMNSNTQQFATLDKEGRVTHSGLSLIETEASNLMMSPKG